MSGRRRVQDLSRDAEEKEHLRQQNHKDHCYKLKLRVYSFTVWILIITATFIILGSILLFLSYAFKCPLVSKEAINLVIQAWTYIFTLITGGIITKFGLKPPDNQ